MCHVLKIREEFANPVSAGIKPFEIRYNDRGYLAGDTIIFVVIGNDKHSLHGTSWEITYVTDAIGLLPNYVVLGIKPL